jgi:hypothetical protein
MALTAWTPWSMKSLSTTLEDEADVTVEIEATGVWF